jgi:hypothetical protein
VCRVHFSTETEICLAWNISKPINGLIESISQESIPFLLPVSYLAFCQLMPVVIEKFYGYWAVATSLVVADDRRKVALRLASDYLSNG